MWGFEGLNYNSGDPINTSDWPQEAYTWTWIQRYHLTEASSAQLYVVALYVALSNIFGGPTDIAPGGASWSAESAAKHPQARPCPQKAPKEQGFG